MEMSASQQVPDNEWGRWRRSSARKQTDVRQSGKKVLILQSLLLQHGPFYDMGAETKAKSGRRIGTAWKHF